MNGSCKKIKKDTHLVIICDEEGIFNAFELAKERLSEEDTLLSFVYAVSEEKGHPLFEQELSILECRFFEYLLVFRPKIERGISCFKQEVLEAVINSNTSKKLRFILFGTESFVGQVEHTLNFLGIPPSQLMLTTINK
jgi:hypothetical protein